VLTLATTVAIPSLVIASALGALIFNAFMAFCLWKLVNAFEDISLSLAKIAAKAKDEGRG
jgi:hypothetical protein